MEAHTDGCGFQPFGGGSPLVQAALEVLVKPKALKEPITADMLNAKVEAVGLTEVRLLVVCLLAFSGFMVKLKCEDTAFNAESMTVRIKSSKTLKSGWSLSLKEAKPH